LDTSAIVAAIANEPDGARFQQAMLTAAWLTISYVTALETRIVLQSRHGDAFRRYGKGRGHPAQLNIIDCAAYALAKIRSEPLLFKGGDFSNTDLQPAL
jgi:ribonuclease VapC